MYPDNTSQQVMHCRCPKNSVAYLVKRHAYNTDQGMGYQFSFACSPQTVSIYTWYLSVLYCMCCGAFLSVTFSITDNLHYIPYSKTHLSHFRNWNVSGKNHVGCSLSRNPLHMRKLMKSPCQVSAPVLTITDAQNIILILVLFLAEFTMITMFEPIVDTACNNQSPESSIQLQTSAVIYRRKFLYDWTSWLLLIAQKTIVIQSTLSCSKYANKYWSC